MNKLFKLFGLLVLGVYLTACSQSGSYKYDSVPGDPLNTRIYTLDNGLKVYLTVNKETPRIQTYIAVRVGAKNDPAETTGLAHYFEHLMFKGTKSFGTLDFEREKPMLDKIESLFETYRVTTDENERKRIYAQIDSVSYEASKLSIPNEYDKLMAAIGAEGTNAYTGFDQTVYVEDIPANEIENWAKIESDRFQNATIRGFHTELETVYEEKNMSLTNDTRKSYEAMLAALYPDYPYGTQTVLGSQQHLKNPSITNIKKYFETWYVPNNIAICLSGDLDPDETMKVIDKYFGKMKPNKNLPERPKLKQSPIKSVVEKEVFGKEAENLVLAWRIPSTTENDLMINLLGNVMYNGKAGLLDVDLIQKQQVLSCFSGNYGLSDASTFLMSGRPKQGQTLDDVKALFLSEVEKLKKGDFDESLLEATINNYKFSYMLDLEKNSDRADMYVNAFIKGSDWKDVVAEIDNMSKITKQQLVDFANKYLGDAYAVIYKRQGTDPNEKKIEKPQITPIVMNRDSVSSFLKEIQGSQVNPIEPVFLDFDQDMEQFEAKSNIPVLYKQNKTNEVFSITYLFDMGSNNDKALGIAASYLKYLGTSKKSLQQINQEFYQLASYFTVQPSTERTYISLTGLQENMAKSMALLEELLADAQVDVMAYKNFAANMLQKRANAKLNQSANFSALWSYALWGPNSPMKNTLSSEELAKMDPQQLVDRIHNLNSFKHSILYYGPAKKEELIKLINDNHKVPVELKDVPQPTVDYNYVETKENNVLFAQYDAKQIYYSAVSNRGEKFDLEAQAGITLYNEYFGGGMNSVVFQEMREARGLAYTAAAFIGTPSKLKYPYYYRSFIATQNDKMIDALAAFDEIINNMPTSEKAFKVAKESLITKMRTERIIKDEVLWQYLEAKDLGLKEDIRKSLFEKIQTMTLEDVKAIQEKWVKGRSYTHCILGDEKSLDMKALTKYGNVKKLTQEDIFGF